MRFQPIRDINVPYLDQMAIFVTCLNYHKLPLPERERIDRLCHEICAGDADMEAALKEALTVGGNLDEIASRHNASRYALYRRRAAFYKRFRP